jgi:hypothetical protein
MIRQIVAVSNMPATFGGQLTLLVSVLTLIGMTYAGHRVYKKRILQEQQHQEWVELLFLWYAQQTGYPVPKELIERHMKINGNSKLPTEIKKKIYGPDAVDPESEPEGKK